MKYVIKLVIFSMLFASCSLYAGELLDSPIGFWKTIDDVTHKPKAIIKISKTPQNKLIGEVVKIFPRPGHDQNELCLACTNEKHNQRIVGMTILENLSLSNKHPKQWSGGTILDPKNGKTYDCFVQVIENGQKLKVRGYIGLPLLGRSQTWVRVEQVA